jgi:hypothetical protein
MSNGNKKPWLPRMLFIAAAGAFCVTFPFASCATSSFQDNTFRRSVQWPEKQIDCHGNVAG